MLGICWEFLWNMQMRLTGTKCLIRHWEYFPVWILGMLIDSYKIFPVSDQTLGMVRNCWEFTVKFDELCKWVVEVQNVWSCRHQEYLPGFPGINTGNVMHDSYHVSAFPSANKFGGQLQPPNSVARQSFRVIPGKFRPMDLLRPDIHVSLKTIQHWWG